MSLCDFDAVDAELDSYATARKDIYITVKIIILEIILIL